MANVYQCGTQRMEEKTMESSNRIFQMDEAKTDNAPTLIGGWERTYDIQGHKPKFDVLCVRCKVSLDKETKMQVRHSVLRLSKNAQMEIYLKEHPDEELPTLDKEEFDPETNRNLMAYKCPHCAWFIRFYIPDTREYLQEVFKKRQYSLKFIPLWETDEMSDDELKEVERQLKSLGYWAGR